MHNNDSSSKIVNASIFVRKKNVQNGFLHWILACCLAVLCHLWLVIFVQDGHLHWGNYNKSNNHIVWLCCLLQALCCWVKIEKGHTKMEYIRNTYFSCMWVFGPYLKYYFVIYLVRKCVVLTNTWLKKIVASSSI